MDIFRGDNVPVANLYRGSYGLANRVPPELIPYNAKTGVTGLQRADNILIGEAGQLYCRQGSRQVFSSESCHSPMPVPGGFLFVQEKNSGAFLSLANDNPSTGDLTISEIGQLVHAGNWLSWFELQGEYWFSTEKERGIVSADMKLRDWPSATKYLAEETEIHAVPLPMGKHIAINGTGVISARGREIYRSEPLQPSIYREATGSFSAAGPVRMLKNVQAGFFYSDDKSVWFVSGLDPVSYTAKKVLNYPAIEYCSLPGLVSASDLGLESFSLGTVFMTTEGPVFGLPDGTAINLTEKQFGMPKDCGFTKGSMTLVNKSNLIISLS